jgi:Spy/CpxP family protein refolding chaperone
MKKSFARLPVFWSQVLGSLVLVAIVLSGSAVQAQRPEGGGRAGGMGGDLSFLLSQPSVQTELKLSEEQRKKATELAEKQRGGFQELRNLSQDERRKKFAERAEANRKSVAEILEPAQLKRVEQISLQQQGAAAYGRPEVVAALGLTSEQQEKFKAIHEESREKMRAAFQGGRPDRDKLEAVRKSAIEQTGALLTAEQKTKWRELTGEPFTGEIRFPEFGGGRRNR